MARQQRPTGCRRSAARLAGRGRSPARPPPSAAATRPHVGAGRARRADDGDTGTSTSMNADRTTPPPGGATAGEVLTRYLHERAAGFLRGLGLRGENEAEADALLRGSARRIGGVLHTYGRADRPGVGRAAAGRAGLAVRDAGPRAAVRRPAGPAARGAAPAVGGREHEAGGARRRRPVRRHRGRRGPRRGPAGAPVDAGQDRAHSRPSRRWAPPASTRWPTRSPCWPPRCRWPRRRPAPAAALLPPLAAQAYSRLAEAAAALPLHRAAHPYNAEAVQASLGAELTADLQDAPWHQVRILLRLSRYAAEVPGPGGRPADPARLAEAARCSGAAPGGGRVRVRGGRRGPHAADSAVDGLRAGRAPRGPAARGGGGEVRVLPRLALRRRSPGALRAPAGRARFRTPCGTSGRPRTS